MIGGATPFLPILAKRDKDSKNGTCIARLCTHCPLFIAKFTNWLQPCFSSKVFSVAKHLTNFKTESVAFGQNG
jgi:hypothetical protein